MRERRPQSMGEGRYLYQKLIDWMSFSSSSEGPGPKGLPLGPTAHPAYFLTSGPGKGPGSPKTANYLQDPLPSGPLLFTIREGRAG